MTNFDLGDISAIAEYAWPLLSALLLLCFAAMWRWRWRDYYLPARLARRQGEASLVDEVSDDASAAVPFGGTVPPQASVVVPCYNSAAALEENLPLLLEQTFAAYEVIVVDEASTDETRDVIKRLSARYPRLRSTFVPATARYVARRKLAITLGVRAARAPWVVLTGADCRPASSQWLARMAEHFADDHDFVLGYANYADDHSRTTRRAIYERLRRNLRNFRAARGRAIGGDMANMAVRKSYFLQEQGYADSLTLSCGEDDLLVDALATPGRTATEVRAEATVLQAIPPEPVLRTERVTRCETLSHLHRHGRLFLLRAAAATWSTWLFVLTWLTYVAGRVALTAVTGLYDNTALPFDIATALLFILAIVLPTYFLRRSCKTLGERTFCFVLMLHYALAAPFRTLVVKCRRYHRRRDFLRR